MTNSAAKRELKAWVRYDGSGRVVSNSIIFRKNKPKVGHWVQVSGYECCDPYFSTTTTSTTEA